MRLVMAVSEVTPFLVAAVLTVLVISSCADQCIVDDIEVQPDFEADQYFGTWYEIKWLPQAYIPPEDRFRDYTHTYTREEDGTVRVKTMARVQERDELCTEYFNMLKFTDTPGKFLYNRTISDTDDLESDYWVIMTDYDQYALVYGCREQKVDGTCMDNMADSWVWSRTPTLEDDLMPRIDERIQELCLELTDFIDTPQEKECELEHKARGSAPIFHWSVFGITMMPFVLHFTLN